MNNILVAFILTIIAGISTLIGTILIFLKINIDNLIKYALAFSAGVMLSISIFDLIPESIKLLINKGLINSYLYILISFILGIIITIVIDKIIPEKKRVGDKQLYKIGLISMSSIIIHNIPEGVATFLSTSTNLKLGLSLTIAIALHNIPEGISIAFPLYKATKNKITALKYTFVAALAEPLGALLAFIFLKDIITNSIMGCILSIITGIMVSISLTKLLPTALTYNNKFKIFLSFIFGIIFIIIGLNII